MAPNFAAETSTSSSSSSRKKKRKHHCHPPVVIPDSQLKSSASTEIDNPPHLQPSLPKNISSLQPTTSDAPLKFLRCSTCGAKTSLTDAHVSDSSDSNSLDIPNVQLEKYDPNIAENGKTFDPNDGDVNSGWIKEGTNIQNSNSSTDIDKEGEVIMEYWFPQTQLEQIPNNRKDSNDPPTTAKPSTMGAYSLIADSLRLSTV